MNNVRINWQVIVIVIIAAAAGYLAFWIPWSLAGSHKNMVEEMRPISLLYLFLVGLGCGLAVPKRFLAAGLASMALFPVIAIVETVRDPTSHILVTEFILYAFLTLPAILGGALGKMIRIPAKRIVPNEVNEASTPGTKSSLLSAARKLSIAQLLIYAGAISTLVLVLVGFIRNLTTFGHKQPMAELFVFVPLVAIIAGWMLSPYWGALRFQRQGARTRGGSVIIIVAVILVIALGANSYLATPALLGGKSHPTAAGVTVMLIPMVQWLVLGLAALLLGLMSQRRTRHLGEATITNNNIGVELNETKRLRRSQKKKMIAGICGGLAKYYSADPTIIRGVFVLFTIFTTGFGVLIYLIMWITVPKESL